LGDTFVLIRNDGSDPVMGTFEGLSEGAVLTIGNASFAISYADGDGNDVVLTVVNVLPVAQPDSYTTSEDTTLTVQAPGVLGNDSDPEGAPLTAVLVSGPSNGTLTLNPD